MFYQIRWRIVTTWNDPCNSEVVKLVVLFTMISQDLNLSQVRNISKFRQIQFFNDRRAEANAIAH